MFPEYHFRGETLSLFGVICDIFCKAFTTNLGKELCCMPVEGPAAVDTRESCRQVHQVKGSVSDDVISNSLIQQEILEMSRNLEISRNGFEILQKFTMAQMI